MARRDSAATTLKALASSAIEADQEGFYEVALSKYKDLISSIKKHLVAQDNKAVRLSYMNRIINYMERSSAIECSMNITKANDLVANAKEMEQKSRFPQAVQMYSNAARLFKKAINFLPLLNANNRQGQGQAHTHTHTYADSESLLQKRALMCSNRAIVLIELGVPSPLSAQAPATLQSIRANNIITLNRNVKHKHEQKRSSSSSSSSSGNISNSNSNRQSKSSSSGSRSRSSIDRLDDYMMLQLEAEEAAVFAVKEKQIANASSEASVVSTHTNDVHAQQQRVDHQSELSAQQQQEQRVDHQTELCAEEKEKQLIDHQTELCAEEKEEERKEEKEEEKKDVNKFTRITKICMLRSMLAVQEEIEHEQSVEIQRLRAIISRQRGTIRSLLVARGDEVEAVARTEVEKQIETQAAFESFCDPHTTTTPLIKPTNPTTTAIATVVNTTASVETLSQACVHMSEVHKEDADTAACACLLQRLQQCHYHQQQQQQQRKSGTDTDTEAILSSTSTLASKGKRRERERERERGGRGRRVASIPVGNKEAKFSRIPAPVFGKRSAPVSVRLPLPLQMADTYKMSHRPRVHAHGLARACTSQRVLGSTFHHPHHPHIAITATSPSSSAHLPLSCRRRNKAKDIMYRNNRNKDGDEQEHAIWLRLGLELDVSNNNADVKTPIFCSIDTAAAINDKITTERVRICTACAFLPHLPAEPLVVDRFRTSAVRVDVPVSVHVPPMKTNTDELAAATATAASALVLPNNTLLRKNTATSTSTDTGSDTGTDTGTGDYVVCLKCRQGRHVSPPRHSPYGSYIFTLSGGRGVVGEDECF